MYNFEQLQMPTNSVRIYAEKSRIQHARKCSFVKAKTLRSNFIQIKGQTDQRSLRSTFEKIKYQEDQFSKVQRSKRSKVNKVQRSKIKEKLNSGQEVNFQKVQRSNQVFDLSSIKPGAGQTAVLNLTTTVTLNPFQKISLQSIVTERGHSRGPRLCRPQIIYQET